MHYRFLGRTGVRVSEVGLGSWLTYGSAVEAAQAERCVRAAIALGVNFIDTADVYVHGNAESVLGRILKEVSRHTVVLATKTFFPMSEDPNDQGLSRKHIFESIHKSLRRLQTDYVDLYQCHRSDPHTPIVETVAAMSDLVRQGKILYWGVSEWSAEKIREASIAADRIGGYRPVSNQPQYHLLHRDIEKDVIPACESLGLGQVVWSPLAGGLLSGKYLEGIPKGSRAADERHGQFLRPYLTAESGRVVRELKVVADDLGISLPQLALAWCLRQKNVSCIITGATKPKQIEENCGAVGVSLTAATLDRIEKILG